MCRKLILLVSLVLVVGLLESSFAVERTWTDNGTGHLWSTGGNWNPSGAPESGDDALIYYDPDSKEGPEIDETVAAVCNRLKTGYAVATGDGTVITMTGGSLHIISWFGHAELEGRTATMNVSGGTIIMDRGVGVGQRGHGVLNVTGGLIQVVGEEYNEGLWVPGTETSSGHLQLDGGRIETSDLTMNVNHAEEPAGFMDITDGLLVIDGDSTNDFGFTVQDYIDKGYITAYGGARELLVEYDPGLDKTTVRALVPELASNPEPADYAENVCPGATLSWTPGVYCVNDHNVYFGTSLDDVSEEAEPCLPHHDSNSFTPSLELGTTYYWRVNEVNDTCGVSPWVGAIWQFTTNDGNAFDLSPADGLRGVSPDVTLDWTSGCLAASDIVYLGTDFNDVNDGTGDANKGSQSPPYDPDLEVFTTYYWRIEGVSGANTWPGEVRSFRTGYGGTAMYYKFDGSEGLDLPSPITDSTGNVTFTKYTDAGWVKYGQSNPVVAASTASADFEPNAGLYRSDPCGPGGWDLLRLDGYQYTIEMWLKPEVLSQEHVDPDNDTWLIGKRGSWRVYINDPDPNNNNTAYSWVHAGNSESMFDDSAVEGEWAHLAAIFGAEYDLSDSTQPSQMRFYLNGVLQESAEETALNPADNNNMVTIGMEELADGSFTGFFDGLIDELRVLDVALTPCDFLTVPGPEWASCPNPEDGEEDVDPCGVVLTWIAGSQATLHKVYFGTDFSEVDNMEETAHVGDNDDPCWPDTGSMDLDDGTTYYWKIVEQGSGPWEGLTWQFTTKYKIEDPNLLLWYKFDETSGDFVRDSSGHGLHGDGDNIGDDDWEPNNGHDGGCLAFDGDQRVDAGLTVLNPIDKEITVTVWLNGGSSSGDNGVFSTGYTYFVEAVVPTSSGDVYWRAGNDTNDVLIWEEASPSAWIGEWHYFAFVKDESDANMYIYFDGLMVDSKTGTANTLANTRNRDFEVGQRDDDEYVGRMDDFRIYDYALSEDEIAEQYRGGNLAVAWGPSPYHGQTDAPPDANLTWRPGNYTQNVNGHRVFFGESWEDVNSMTDPCATKNLGDEEYDPGLLELATTYYWRIDEVCEPCTWPGPIWSFAVADYIIIDNFESYNETDNKVASTWYDNSRNATGSWCSLAQETYGKPVYSGKKAMLYEYYTDAPPEWWWITKDYAEAWLEYDPPQDWITPGVRLVTLFFYGQAGNDYTDAEQMYVGVEDSGGLYAEMRYGDNAGEDMNDINEPEWHRWDIPFAYFSDSDFTESPNDVNFRSIFRFSIGFGDRDVPVPAGEGAVYFDDIRLGMPRCIPEYAVYDLSGDCDVGLADVGEMGMQWLRSDINVAPVTEPNDANLVAHWELEGNADDSTANAYHGTAQGAVTWVTGKVGSGAAKFDGGWIVVEDDGNTPKLRIKHYVSVTAWVYLYGSAGEEGKVVIKGEDDEETFGLEVDDEDGAAFIMRDANDLGNVLSVQSGGDAIYGDEWIHIAGTYDQNEQLIYVNGVEEGSETRGAIELFTDANDGLGIAGRYGDGAEFDGTIDDVRVYDRVLTRAEIAWLASDGSGLIELTAKANFFKEAPDPEVINFKDFAILLEHWLDPPELWP